MELVYLRALELDDFERTYKWHNDATLYESLAGTFRYTNRSLEEEWLRKMQTYSSQQLNLAICIKNNSEHIGNIYLRDIDWVARRGELHIFIGEADHRRKGCGEAATRLVIKHAFQDLGLLRLYLFVLEGNEAAIKMYEKCGFVVEGKLHKHAFKRGEFRNLLVMGICADDFSKGK